MSSIVDKILKDAQPFVDPDEVWLHDDKGFVADILPLTQKDRKTYISAPTEISFTKVRADLYFNGRYVCGIDAPEEVVPGMWWTFGLP